MRLTITALFLALSLTSTVAVAHSGGVDENGCHTNSKTGEHHCHDDSAKAETSSKNARTQNSGSGIPDYDRELYMPNGWEDVDGDCMNTRHEVLQIESYKPVQLSDDGCYVESGEWHDPYTGEVFTDPKELHIDHVVPLAEAHRSGAWEWSAEKKRAFANDMDYPHALMAVEAGANMSKSDDDPARWRPENKAFTCEYLQIWVTIKNKWGLQADRFEYETLKRDLNKCGTPVQ